MLYFGPLLIILKSIEQIYIPILLQYYNADVFIGDKKFHERCHQKYSIKQREIWGI